MTPHVPMRALDTLWFQVAGTICNIECMHALFHFVVADVKEYYFTGGGPFLNREMIPILAATLKQGPATVLTNGMLLRKEVCGQLRAQEMRAERLPDEFIETIETGWWTTCLEILPARERAAGKF